MPKTRHERALAMFNHGASNPRAIIHELRKTLVELDAEHSDVGIGMADTKTVTFDPALRLMVYQLATVFEMEPFAHSANVMEAREDCERHMKTQTES